MLKCNVSSISLHQDQNSVCNLFYATIKMFTQVYWPSYKVADHTQLLHGFDIVYLSVKMGTIFTV